MTPGPLDGLRVVDLSRNAPGPYASMLLADLGAEVIMVSGGRAGEALPELSRGKQLVTLDLKTTDGQAALHLLVRDADVLIEGFRPGVAERLGAGYEELSGLNPRLVYCSLTGYGQDGPLRAAAAHDINYLALAGFLGAVGPVDAPPLPPLNVVADLAGGGLFAAFGILAALHRRQSTGRGDHLDVAMVDGVLSTMATWFPAWGTPVLPQRGAGLVAGAAPFYRTYECRDGRHVAVGAIEAQFFAALWSLLKFDDACPDHLNPATWPRLTERLETRFRTRTRDEWATVGAGTDACLTPVLAPDEVWGHPQNAARHPQSGPDRVPVVPRFATDGPVEPAAVGRPDDRTQEILLRAGADPALIAAVRSAGEASTGGGLVWPPVAGDPTTGDPRGQSGS